MIMATITHEQVATSTCKESTERFCAFSVESSVTFSYVIYSTGSEPASKQLELQKKAVPTFLRFFSFLFLNCAVNR